MENKVGVRHFRAMLPAVTSLAPSDLLLSIPELPEVVVVRIDRASGRYPNGDGLFSDDERLLFDALSGSGRRRSFVAGRLAAKVRIAGLLTPHPVDFETLSWPDFDIARAESGEPTVRERGISKPDIFVSISHGGDFAAADAGIGRRTGIDVEPISSRCTDAGETFANDAEVRLLLERRESAALADEHYTRLFSAKEAAAKYLGTHMYFAFHHYRAVRIDGIDAVQVWTVEDRSAGGASLSIHSVSVHGHIFSRVLAPDTISTERKSQ